jgi:hypothetical protein
MTVTVAVLEPGLAAETFTLAVSVPLFEPEAGVIVNHGVLLLAVQVPLEVTVTVWSAGLAPPCVAVNVRLVGDRLKEAAVTVKVTLTVLVVFPLITVSVPVLVPTAAALILALTVRVPFPDPDVGLTVNQALLLLAVQLPLEVRVTDWSAGLAPPCVAVNVRLLGARLKEAAVTVKETATVRVVLPLVTVIVAVLAPTAAALILTLAVRVPFPDPEVGVTVNHALLLLAVQVPSDVTVMDSVAGLLSPWMPE